MNAPAHPDLTAEREVSYTREEIEGSCDIAALSEWYLKSDGRELQIRAFINAWREAEIDDEEWFRKTAGALAYCVIGKRWIERRILTLGGTPPYVPTDPRARQLRMLNDKVAKLEQQLAAMTRATMATENG